MADRPLPAEHSTNDTSANKKTALQLFSVACWWQIWQARSAIFRSMREPAQSAEAEKPPSSGQSRSERRRAAGSRTWNCESGFAAVGIGMTWTIFIVVLVMAFTATKLARHSFTLLAVA